MDSAQLHNVFIQQLVVMMKIKKFPAVLKIELSF
jgi:hypothetical protein